MRVNKVAPLPLKETGKAFYKENAIDDHDRFPVGNPRYAHLEEVELRKPVFTGESHTHVSTKKPEVLRNNTIVDKKGKLATYTLFSILAFKIKLPNGCLLSYSA